MEMQVFGYAITFLSIVLAIISWRNGRDMKAAVSAIQADIQASREQTARQHEQVIGLLQAIREQTARQHEDAMALLREMHEGVERMHAETQRVLLRIAELIAAEGERTRAALSGGRSRPQK
jgi:iron-sulfur cluster repair protein YtfE (RIC family)